MKTARIIIAMVLSVLLLVCCILTTTATYQINRSGEWSSVCHVSDKGKQWIIDRFGHITDTNELINSIEQYALDNFAYSKDYKMDIIQSFDFDKFVFEDGGKSGVCFELACWAKCCLVTVSDYQQKDAKIFVIDMRSKGKLTGTGHSYNYVVEDGKAIAFDLVCSFNGNKWRRCFNSTDVFACARSMGENPYNIY